MTFCNTAELGNGSVRAPPAPLNGQRQQLMRECQRFVGTGRGLLALHNIHVTGKSWKGKAQLRSGYGRPA